MITNQIIQNSITELKSITRIDFEVYEPDGMKVAATTGESAEEALQENSGLIREFAESPADSQVIGTRHLLKVFDEEETAYILVSIGTGEDAYVMGKVAVSQLQALISAYKERYDRNSFYQNLLMDNLLLVDIYNRAKKLRIDTAGYRVIYLVEAKQEKDGIVTELLKGMYSPQSGDVVTAVDEDSVILIKNFENEPSEDRLEEIATTIVSMLNTEALLRARVAYGTVVQELKDLSKSYKEAKMAAEVGRIFYAERNVSAYASLGIGRLIYQLPRNLCEMFIHEIFGEKMPDVLDEETLSYINKFFENNMNVLETSKNLYLHRNTLVYRIEKVKAAIGLDLRNFYDALTFKIAMMVVSYLRYLDSADSYED